MSSAIPANAESTSGQNTTAYDYPIKPGTSEWSQFDDHAEMVDACQIPEDVLKTMSTDALIETVLNYPLLDDIYAYDTFQEGFDAVSEHFNGLLELLNRGDAGSELLAKYQGMDVTTDANTVTSKWGPGALVKHFYTECPYYYSSSNISYWYR